MSGGVDSSVAAGLLVRRGYEVIGVTLQIWQETQTDPRHSGCCSLGAVEDARRVARKLGIAHYVLNFRDLFEKTVISNFVSEYEAGRTPNPCVQCNRHVKFDPILERLPEFGAQKVATGHYARIRKDRQGRYRLLRARSIEKDQSYVLFMLAAGKLDRLAFPLGELPDKTETRRLAAEWGLPVAHKPDSQEICFVSEAGGYREFLLSQRAKGMDGGEIRHVDGRVLGQHGGTAGFTIGQRRGLGVNSGDGKPLFVLDVLPETRTVVVGPEERLYRSVARVEDPVWGSVEPEGGPLRCMAKIRYNMQPQKAVLHRGESPYLEFDKPIKAITPGQTAVAYVGSSVAFGGTISASE